LSDTTQAENREAPEARARDEAAGVLKGEAEKSQGNKAELVEHERAQLEASLREEVQRTLETEIVRAKAGKKSSDIGTIEAGAIAADFRIKDAIALSESVLPSPLDSKGHAHVTVSASILCEQNIV